MLRGMFAFAIWDAWRHQLFLCPRSHGHQAALLRFLRVSIFFLPPKSEPCSGLGWFRADLNPAGLANYLAFGSLYDPITLIKGVSVLRPGHSLVWKTAMCRRACTGILVGHQGQNSGRS